MAEVSVFDVYRVSRALEGQLTDGDRLHVVARDDISRDYWALTEQELVILAGDDIVNRVNVDDLRGAVTRNDTGLHIRVVDVASGAVLLSSFRRANKFTDALEERLKPDSA